MKNVIIIMILAVCVGGACYDIYVNRKKGVKCMGCPHEKSCSGGCSSENKTSDTQTMK